jgi:glutamyl/glutaminyl-tRNA synthetase
VLKPVGRLAPTPSGNLHLGNALAFAACWLSARSKGGRLLLRVEDVDQERARPDIAAAQRQDLRWMGCGWDTEVERQGLRDYQPWLDRLSRRTYRCICSRKELKISDGKCACPDGNHDIGSVRFRLEPTVIRFEDRRFGPIESAPHAFPDPTLRRADGVFTYNLAVVADDIADGVTEVVRGADLLDYTAVQIQLWRAFGATPPTWLHTPVVLGADGRKLSKSHGSAEIGALRNAGWTAGRLWRTVLPGLGIEGVDNLDDALAHFEPASGARSEIRFPLDA